MTTVASQITSFTVVYSIVYSGAYQRKIKAPRNWPLWGEFTGTGEFPAQRASNAENGSIWWRHHEYTLRKWYGDTLDSQQTYLLREPSTAICISGQWPTPNVPPGTWHEHITTLILSIMGNCLGPIWLDWCTVHTTWRHGRIYYLDRVKDAHPLWDLLGIWF